MKKNKKIFIGLISVLLLSIIVTYSGGINPPVEPDKAMTGSINSVISTLFH